MSDTRRSMLLGVISKAGDRYGYGPNGIVELMDETNAPNTKDISDDQIERFCGRHGLLGELTGGDKA